MCTLNAVSYIKRWMLPESHVLEYFHFISSTNDLYQLHFSVLQVYTNLLLVTLILSLKKDNLLVPVSIKKKILKFLSYRGSTSKCCISEVMRLCDQPPLM